MQPEQSTLDVIYENWQGYNAKLRAAVAPLTAEQLRLQPAPHMWPLEQIVQHIISVRAGWFSATLQDSDEAMDAYMEWGQRESPARSGANWRRALTRRGPSSNPEYCAGHPQSAPCSSPTSMTAKRLTSRAVGLSTTCWSTTSTTAARSR